MKIVNLLLLLFVITSCASYKDIKIVDNKLTNCEVLDKLTGINKNGSEQAAARDLRQKALELGGDSVFITDTISNGKVYEVTGLVYDCK